MKRKKIFGIGAVVLLLLISVMPAINGLDFHSEKLNIKCIKSLEVRDIYCEIKRCEFIKYSLNKAIYEIEWVVWFNGPIVDDRGYCVLKVGNRVFDSWQYHINFMKGFDSGTRKLRLISSEDPSIDEERNFAGKTVTLEVHSNLGFKNNNDCFVKYWSDNQDYIPTDPQIEISAPCWWKKTFCVPEIPDLYKLEFFDVRILPNILLSERLGWVGQAANYFIQLSENITAMLGATIAFLLLIKDDIKIITEWIIDVIEWFLNILKGIFYGGFADLIHNFIQFVLPAADRIFIQATIWGGTVAILGQKLSVVINRFYEWTLDDPWTKQIKIYGRIDNVKPGETVIVMCREIINKSYSDSEGDGRIDFVFSVNSTPMYNEKRQEGIHNCLITVKGNKHINSVSSIPILSYAFANGSLFWHFNKPGDNVRKKTTEEVFFFDRLINFPKNKPLLNFLKKILEKTKATKKTKQKSASINRDFNLDELMKKVKEEKYKQYEGLVYKPYYPGAPADPKIVYYSSNQVIVGFKSYVDITQIDDVVGYPVVDKLIELNTAIVEIYGIEPEDFMEIVNQSEDVEYTELNFVYQNCYTPNDILWNEQWGPKAIHCTQAWDLEKGDWDVSIAILDTGCNYNHEDISNKQSSVNYDFVNNDNDPMDDCYVNHGTHCAGIIGATIDNHKGIAGVAPEAWTDYIKILDSNGFGFASTIAKGIIHTTKYNDQIISMSLGGYGISVCLHAACDYAYYVKNTLIIAAAGNDGLPILCYPARFESVISVGAIDKNLNLCRWSNYGPKLDLVAPGLDIISTVGTYGYKKLSGTSMATPHVAGVAALILSAFPNYNAITCRGKLFSTAIDLGGTGKDNKYGYGLVNAYGAVKKSKSIESNSQIFNFLSIHNITSNILKNKAIIKFPNLFMI